MREGRKREWESKRKIRESIEREDFSLFSMPLPLIAVGFYHDPRVS